MQTHRSSAGTAAITVALMTLACGGNQSGTETGATTSATAASTATEEATATAATAPAATAPAATAPAMTAQSTAPLTGDMVDVVYYYLPG